MKISQRQIAGILIAVSNEAFDAMSSDTDYQFKMPDDFDIDASFDMAEPETQTLALAQARAIINYSKAT